jgi:endonuclease/exonuclease/phosphatase family metal-dependent hydrolase
MASNRAEAIAAATGYQWDWKVAHDVAVYQEGTGFVSRWPVLWTEAIDLPHGEFGITKRVTIGAGIDTPYGELAFFSSHATLSPDEAVKADQALATWQLMSAHDNGQPAFLGADMNAEPGTLAMRMLRGEATHDGYTGDLLDAWTAANPSLEGLTNPSDAPDKRIDYVYVRNSDAAAISCELVLTAPVDGLYASDHLGVMCDVSWPH